MTDLLPPALEKFERYSTLEAHLYLTARFKLNWHDQMQDWDIENADADMLPAFLSALSEPTLSDDERYALMTITIASLDEALQIGIDSKIIQAYLSRLEAFLLQHPYLYISIVLYWAEPTLLKWEEPFLMSPHMALIWSEILKKIGCS